MAAAAPQALEGDSLEVTRSAHMLTPGMQEPSASTRKALSASQVLLQAKAEKKAARIAKNQNRRAVGFTGAEDLAGGDDDDEVEMDSDDELSTMDALREADISMDVGGDEVVRDKVKTKVKATKPKKKSALRTSGAGLMSMD